MVWIGGYEVRATPKCAIFGNDVHGAFVNVVVDCQTESEFREAAAKALIEDHYEILGIEEVMEIDLADSGFPQSELALLNDQILAGGRVVYGCFQTYPKDGLDA